MIAKCVWWSWSIASFMMARASFIVAACSTLGRNLSRTPCQSRPPSLGSKCLSRIVVQIMSNASTFFARWLAVSVSGSRWTGFGDFRRIGLLRARDNGQGRNEQNDKARESHRATMRIDISNSQHDRNVSPAGLSPFAVIGSTRRMPTAGSLYPRTEPCGVARIFVGSRTAVRQSIRPRERRSRMFSLDLPGYSHQSERRSVAPRSREQIDGERGEPVLTGVISAGHVFERGLGMTSGRD